MLVVYPCLTLLDTTKETKFQMQGLPAMGDLAHYGISTEHVNKVKAADIDHKWEVAMGVVETTVAVVEIILMCLEIFI